AGADGKPALSAAQIEGAFRDTKPEQLLAMNQVVTDSIKTVSDIDNFITNTVGADKAPNLDALKAELKNIQKAFIRYLPAGTVAVTEDGAASPQANAGSAAPQAIAGEIQSRKDVIMTLEKICHYYSRT